MKTALTAAVLAATAIPAAQAEFIVFDDRASFIAALDAIMINDDVNQFSGLELDFENSTVNTVTPGPMLSGFDVGHSGDETVAQFVDGTGVNWGVMGVSSPNIQFVLDRSGAPSGSGSVNNVDDTGRVEIQTAGVNAFGFDLQLFNDGGGAHLLGPEAGADIIVTAGAEFMSFTPRANAPFFGVISLGGDLSHLDLVIGSQVAAGGFEIIGMDNFVGGVSSIPAPGAIALLGMSGLLAARRRRG